MTEHLQDKLGCNTAHLKIGLSLLKQGDRDMVSFAQEFERRAKDAEYDEEGAKALLISNLNPSTLFRLDNFVSTQYPHIAAGTESMTERLRRISYVAMMGFLKQSSLQELASNARGPAQGSGINAVDSTAGTFPQSNFHAAGIFST